MSVLIDDPAWKWRGRLWSHLVSDHDLEELHDFARRLRVRYMAFQLDHYDIPEELWAAAVDLGAQVVSSRELVRRLRASGLRVSGSHLKSWNLLTRAKAGTLPELSGHLPPQWSPGAEAWLSEAAPWGEIIVVQRPGEVVIHAGVAHRRPLAPPPPGARITHSGVVGDQATELVYSGLPT